MSRLVVVALAATGLCQLASSPTAARPHYTVALAPAARDAVKPHWANENAVRMTDAQGRVFVCHIPRLISSADVPAPRQQAMDESPGLGEGTAWPAAVDGWPAEGTAEVAAGATGAIPTVPAVPWRTVRTPGGGEGENQGEEDGDLVAAVAAVLEGLRLADEACIKKKDGWWTYELCHFDEVRQYHADGR